MWELDDGVVPHLLIVVLFGVLDDTLSFLGICTLIAPALVLGCQYCGVVCSTLPRRSRATLANVHEYVQFFLAFMCATLSKKWSSKWAGLFIDAIKSGSFTALVAVV